MKLKILQWNIWFKEDPKNIASEIKRINPDIVCVQEVSKHEKKSPQIDTAEEIAKLTGLGLFYHDSATWDNRPEKTAQGNAIFSKYPFSNASFSYVHDFNHNPKDATEEGRLYLEAEVLVGDKKITISTTHLSYSPSFEITDERKKEVDNLVEIIKNKKENYIFTGDLNSAPDSYTIKSLEKYLKNTGPEYEEKTWATKLFDYHGFKEDKLNWRIDYVFATKDVKVISSKIIDTPYSDHLPILVEVEV